MDQNVRFVGPRSMQLLLPNTLFLIVSDTCLTCWPGVNAVAATQLFDLLALGQCSCCYPIGCFVCVFVCCCLLSAQYYWQRRYYVCSIP